MRIRIGAVALVGAFTFGCSSSTSGASPGGTGTSGGGTASGSALTCTGILECASKCADGDQPCEDACVAKGSPDAKAAVEDIVTCSTQNSCADEACFKANCSKELAACVKPPTGQPLTGELPPGNVPSDLVGQWYSFGELWDFKADGSVIHGANVKTSGCNTSSNESGTAVASGEALSVYFKSGGVSLCGGSQMDPYAPNVTEFTYKISEGVNGPGSKLSLTDKTCLAKPGGSDFYCTNGFDRK